MARNFGYAESENHLYKEITHAGYFAFTELGAHLRNLSPSFQFMLASGNKVPLEQAGDSSYTSGRNMAFSSYSPLNKNIGGSISACNGESRPIVVMGSGCGLHVGLPRPRTLASSDFDNLIMPSLGFDLGITKNLKLGLRNYYIISFARPVGTLGGEARYLSRELGDEIDLWVDYRLNKNTTLSFLGGYFIPGRYYREKRDDASGSLFSPYLRGDGNPNAAYQLEFSLEFQY